MMRAGIRKSLLLFLLSLLFTVCIGIFPYGASAGQREISEKTVTLEVGESRKLEIRNAGTSRLIWKSSDQSIASVSAKGRVSAKKVGKAVITARAGKNKWTCLIQVTEKTGGSMLLVIRNKTLAVHWDTNEAVKALKRRVEKEALVLSLHDYGAMEKVGNLGFRLPTSDRYMSVDALDLILYQGDQFSIYYDKNAWSFTHLGRIQGVLPAELRQILGAGDVQVTIRME